ncbi:MAG: Glu/Leu/Phe/Val dehydrogenase [Pseudomonadales bacterium]
MATQSFAFCDDLGPEKVIELYDPAAGLKSVLVVDNVAAGPSIGGVRMAPDVTMEECARLARAMTLKNAMAGLPHGGGKAVIMADPAMPAEAKERLVRSFAYAVKDVGDYITGPDMGTNEHLMACVRDVNGRSVGLPRELGGIPLDEIGATGFGLAVALEASAEFGGPALDGARIVVQGFGSVGQHAARFLAERGARLVAVSDSQGARAAPEGFDLDALLAWKAQGHSVAAFAQGAALDPDDLVAVACDVWIPAARPDVIREDNVARLDTRVLAQGANIPATAGAEQRLAQRGVLVLPDFVANAGGVICASVEYHGGTESQAMAAIEERICANVRAVLARATDSGAPPRAVALELARERVLRAMSVRRTW